jgi:GNAT superfamily N-acetyltransferase
MIKLRTILTENNGTGQELLDKFIVSLDKYGLEYHGTDSPDAFRWRGNIYPTITNPEKTVKVGLDRTDIFDREGQVWVGDPTCPLLNGWVIQAIVTDPEHRGKGEASKVLSQIVKAADDNGIMFKGEPVPMKDFIKRGQQKLTRNQLIKWYKRHGFEPNERGNIITRNPKKINESSHDDHIKSLEKWLDDQKKKAPGNTHEEKINWLHANNPKYYKVVDVLLKMIRNRPRIHPDAYKSKFNADLYYVRFGDLPKSGKSMNHLVKREEKGISSYPVIWDNKLGKWKLDTSQLSDIGMSTLDSMISDFIENKGRPIYLIYGQSLDDLGIHDDEPLLDASKIKVVKKLHPQELYIDEFGGNEWYGND